ncbi:MAG: tyrosine-type recombinase/integrase [candidate division Zixibacteria bacterium]|nr:tyrosine-type recombinase/integrase [candidate division Zixibacteria bacterium]
MKASILVRCRCRTFYKPRDNDICNRCGLRYRKLTPCTHYVDFSHEGKRYRKSLKARTLDFAEKELKGKTIDELLCEQEKIGKPRTVTFEKAVQDYLAYCQIEGCSRRRSQRKPNRGKTLASKRTSFYQYWFPLIGAKTPLEKIPPDIAIRFKESQLATVGERIGRVRSPRSINLDLRYFLSFSYWAMKNDLPLNAKVTDFSYLPEEGKSGRVFTAQEMDAIVLATLGINPEEARDLILFVIAEGPRAWSEAADMEKSWVNLEEGSYTIPAEKSKSRKAVTRYLGDFSLKILERRAKSTESEYLFPNPKTGKPFTCLSKTLNRIGRQTEVGHIRMKDFRHNWISQGKRDHQPELVSFAIGHSERTTTLHYTWYGRDQYRQVVNDVQSRLFRSVYHSVSSDDIKTVPSA